MAGIGIIWGSQFVFNELAIRALPPLTVAAGRILIGFSTLSLIVLILPKSPLSGFEGEKSQPWGLYCAIALAEAILPCFLIPWGQQHVDSGIAAILLATVPIFTLVLATIFVPEERWGLIAAASVVVGFIGVLVLVVPNIEGNWMADILGELAILGGALSFSLSLIMMKHLSDVPPVLAMRNVFMIGSVPLVLLAAVLDAPLRLNFASANSRNHKHLSAASDCALPSGFGAFSVPNLDLRDSWGRLFRRQARRVHYQAVRAARRAGSNSLAGFEAWVYTRGGGNVWVVELSPDCQVRSVRTQGTR